MTNFTNTAERVSVYAPGGARVRTQASCGVSQTGGSPAGDNDTLGWMEKILAGGPQYTLSPDRVSRGYSLQNREAVIRRGADRSVGIPFPLSCSERIANGERSPGGNRHPEEAPCY